LKTFLGNRQGQIDLYEFWFKGELGELQIYFRKILLHQ